MYLGTMFFDPIVGTPIARFDPDASSLLGEETMFYVASIYRHVRTVRITAESLEEMSCGQGWQPGTIVESAQSRLEIDTKLVVDRLLRECFTQNSSRGMGRTDIS